MIEIRSLNYCFPDKRSCCPMLPSDAGDHYLEREFELARRSSTYGMMVKSGRLSDGLWFWDLENREHCYVSPGFWRILGFDPATKPHLMAEWTSLMFEEDLAHFGPNVDAHLADPDVPFDQILRCRTADGATLLVRTRGVALFDNGVPRRMSGTHQILSDTRVHELSEKMAEILELSNDAITVWSPQRGAQRWNRGAERMFGYSRKEMEGRQPRDILRAECALPWRAILARVEAGETWSGDITWIARSGATVHTSTTMQRIAVTGGDTMILQMDHDVTAKVELRERQRIMTRELNHRVKNLFAVIRSLVKLSAMGRDDVPTLVRELDQRIAALAAAHVVSLGYEMEDGGPLGEILEAVLAPYPADRAALTLDGPALWLPQGKITPMGLILNELATNALKYGAWATLDGHVSVRWAPVQGEGTSLVRLTWEEHSPAFTPAGTASQRRGFGSDLIEMSTAQMGAILTRGEGPSGIRLTLTFEAGLLPQPMAPSTFHTSSTARSPMQ
ncbi:sensor histidine kinase [Acuticoccus sediminis]|uniref:sensor histidine kinase n=1 Tax=Acuticoccus sediminis TaxID=2184697 RepID=UPI001CFD8ABF|nr:PAS domain-containing protein [Acuticoccus sediminis]